MPGLGTLHLSPCAFLGACVKSKLHARKQPCLHTRGMEPTNQAREALGFMVLPLREPLKPVTGDISVLPAWLGETYAR